jgi:glucokinase
MSSILAVDFGGTNIRVAHFTQPHPPASQQLKRPTEAQEGPSKVLERLKDAIRELLPEDDSDVKIGIAAPGPLDPVEGVILSAPNLAGWTDIPLRKQLEDTFGYPVYLGNDANLAALGEWKHGAGVGTTDMIYLTISTGIGGGVITHGQLLTGKSGLAAELGHVTIDPSGARCGCGLHGHIEALASGPSITRTALQRMQEGAQSSLQEMLEKGQEITAKDISQAAEDGDKLALEVITQAGQIFGHHLANLSHIFNPELFVLGGGVSMIGEMFFAPIRQSLEEHVMDPAYLTNLRVVPAALGDDAGLVGAMALADLE